jgi:hypothetical protein
VDNIVDEVPDAAPEIDVEVASADDVAAALHNTAGVPNGAEIYLQVWQDVRHMLQTITVRMEGSIAASSCSVLMYLAALLHAEHLQ